MNTRLPGAVVSRLRAHRRRLERARPGARVTFADAHRDALLRGLAAVEAPDRAKATEAPPAPDGTQPGDLAP